MIRAKSNWKDRSRIFRVFFALLIVLCFTISVTAQVNDKPNILWITFEDTSPQYIGCYGNQNAHTPNIDSLAKQGVIFNYAYANGTVCSPARSTLITGVSTEVMGTGHHRSSFPIPNTIKGFPTYLREQGYYTTNNNKTDYNTSNATSIIASSWDENSGSATWANKPAGSPFFAVFNVFESHQTRTMHEPHAWYEENVLARLKPEEKVSMWDIAMPPYFRDTPEMRKSMVRVYNSLSLTDRLVGEIIQKLEDDGLKDETIIFIYADHGEGLPRGKGSPNAQGYRVPFIAWFPPKYQHLSPWSMGEVTDELISFEDLAPTMLSLSNAPIPTYMKGRPFMGSLRKDTDDHAVFGSRNNLGESPGMERSVMKGKYLYTRVFIPDLPEAKFNVYYDQSDIMRLSRNDFLAGKLSADQSVLFEKRRSIEFLYDIEKDPWELNNLADNSEYSTLLKELRAEVYSDMEEKRDAHLFPHYELTQLTLPPGMARLDDAKLPVSQIMEVVKSVGMETPEAIDLQINALSHEHKLVRYWALIGLRMHRSGLDDHMDEIKLRLDDTYLLNTVQAAGILYRNWQDPMAKQVLEAHALHENREVSTETMSVIQYLYEDALVFEPLLEQVIAKNQFFPSQIAKNILHYYKGERLAYNPNATEALYRPYHYFSFDEDLEDGLHHADLIQHNPTHLYDGIRGYVSHLDSDHPAIFDEEFFLASRFGITLWIRPDDLLNDQTIISFANRDTSRHLALKIDDQDRLKMVIDGNSYWGKDKLIPGEWTYLSLSYGFEDRWRVSLNGRAQLNQIYPYDPEFMTRGMIFNDFEENETSFISGRIDDLTIYHFDFDRLHDLQAYRQEDVPTGIRLDPFHLYTFQTGLTDSMMNSDLTANTVQLVNDDQRARVISLNASPENALLSTGVGFSLDTAFTLSTWFNVNKTTKWQSLFALGDSKDFVYFTPFAFGDGKPYLVIDDPHDSRRFLRLDTDILNTNDWIHFALTYHDGIWICYLNGQTVLQASVEFNAHEVRKAYIGRLSHNTGSYFDGFVDDFAIYHGALSQGEINLLIDRKASGLQVYAAGDATVIAKKEEPLQFFFNLSPANVSLKQVSWELVGETLGAVINEDGLLTAGTKDGMIEIRGTAKDGSGVQDTWLIEQQVEVKVESLKLKSANNDYQIVKKGAELQLEVEVSPDSADNKQVIWRIQEPDLGCSVSEDGRLTCGEEAGEITVRVEATDGSGVFDTRMFSIAFADLILGVHQLKNEEFLYPNPGNEFMISGLDGIKKMLIYDLSGQLVAELASPSPLTYLDVSHLPNGEYYVLAFSDDKKVYQRIIKK